MNLKKIFFPSPKKSGESITEVLIAIFILAAVLISAFAMLNRSIGANINVKNRIIALNIAREGIEAVRNIRDTNWLKYSGDRRGSWLCWDKEVFGQADYLDNCLPASTDPGFKTIQTGFYVIDFSKVNHRYFLEDKGPDVKINLTQTGQQDLRLYQIPKAKTFAGRYTHKINDGLGTNYNPTPFFRQIEVEVLNPFVPNPNPLAIVAPAFCDNDVAEPNCTKHRARIATRVHWREGLKTQSVTLESYIYDFYERDDY